MYSVFSRFVCVVCLVLSGAAFAQTQTLPSGWSLVGNDTGTAIDPNAIFGNATTPTAISASVTTVWSWNSGLSRWNFFSPSMTPQALSDYATAKNYGVLASIAKGEGFWVNAKSQFLYAPTVVNNVDITPLQGSNSSVSRKSSASGSGCSAMGIQTVSSSSGYMSISVTTVGSLATVNLWDSSTHFIFALDYQSGNNTTGYNLTGTFNETIGKFSGAATASSFRKTSSGSYVGSFTATMNNCTMSGAIS